MMSNRWTSGLQSRSVPDRLVSRTALPVFAVGCLLLAIGVYGAWRVHRLHKRGSDMLSENVASIRAAEQLGVIANEIRHRLKRHMNSRNERQLEEIDELLVRGDVALRKVETLATTPREKELTQRTRVTYDRLKADFDSIASEPSSIVRRETMAGMADHLIPEQLVAHAAEYIRLNEQSLDSSARRNESTANRLMFGLLLLGTCGGVAGLIIGYCIARLVNRTIVQLAVPIRDTAGKLSQVAGPVAWSTKPGFDDLESVLRAVSSQVATVVERLQDSERDRLRAEQLAAVGQLAAGLAHELRNPLTAMMAILQLASKPEELTDRDLEVLREESGRLEHTVQSLLDFARPAQPRKTETDICALLEHTVLLVERQCHRKGVALTYLRARAGLTLLADGAQLRQLVLNLLLNAIDATPRGGKIQLDCQLEVSEDRPSHRVKAWMQPGRDSREQRWVVIRVSDSGVGIPEQLRTQLFEPFVTTKETGTGLGLSICRQIVQCHGGGISAMAREGGGALLEARFPQGVVSDTGREPGDKDCRESPAILRLGRDADSAAVHREDNGRG